MSELYTLRLKRIADAVALKEPDAVPLIPKAVGVQYTLCGDGSSHKSEFYEYEKAMQACIQYHAEFQPDYRQLPDFLSGKANEFVQPGMIDWPGRPGTKVPDHSSWQVIEQEYMAQDEYDELISDYTGFMLTRYIPRAFAGLEGFKNFIPNLAPVLGTKTFSPMINPAMKEALLNFVAMINESEKVNTFVKESSTTLEQMGFPPYFTSMGGVPFDIVGDYFRGTMGMFEDLLEVPDKIYEACQLFARMQMRGWEPQLHAEAEVKRIYFPLHKGMDGFMSPSHYDTLYWQPFQTMLIQLMEHGVTPIIYTEGPYETRIDYIRDKLLELPPASCILHFEAGDFALLKKKFEGIACISGGMPLYLLEWGTVQEVVDRVKYLIDNCAAGGGFLLNSSGSIENAKRENYEAMFETARSYGKSSNGGYR